MAVERDERMPEIAIKSSLRKIKRVKKLEPQSKYLNILTQRLARKYFHISFPHPVIWNKHFKTCGGYFMNIHKNRQVPSFQYIAINPEMLTRNDLNMLIGAIKHELIHYWLWKHHKLYGHTKRFHQIARKIHTPIHCPIPENYLKPYHHFHFEYECTRCHHKSYQMHYEPTKYLECARCGGRLKLVYVMDQKQYHKEKQAYK